MVRVALALASTACWTVVPALVGAPGAAAATGPTPLPAAIAATSGSGPQSQADPARPMLTNRVNVVWRPGTGSSAKRRGRSAAGAVDIRALGRDGFETITLPAGADTAQVAAALRRDPNVAVAEPDRISLLDSVPDDPLFWLQDSLEAGAGGINAVGAWETTVGSSDAVVAILDTGFRITHPDLAQRAWSNPMETANGYDDDGNGIADDLYGADLVGSDMDNPTRDGDPTDDIAEGGHGVHTAGIAGAAGNNGIGISGVAQVVKLMPLRVCSYSMKEKLVGCPESAQIEAINYAGEHSARVANLSFGGAYPSAAVLAALAANDETLFVMAAGNASQDNDTTPHYPCAFDPSTAGGIDNVVCVAATDDSDSLAYFSNWGATSVDLGAPGVSIPSTYPLHFLFGEDFNSSSFAFNGWTRDPDPGFIRSTGAPLSSGGITNNTAGQLPGSTRTVTTPGTSIGITAGTRCTAYYFSELAVGAGDAFGVSALLDDTAVANSDENPITSGYNHLHFDVPEGTAQRQVAIQFAYTRGTSTPNTNGVWLDEVSIECFTPPGSEGADAYGYMSGTSMAAPHVAGAVALLASYEPGASTTDLRNAIIAGVDPIPELDPLTGSHPVTSGGRLDAVLALAGIDAIVAPDTEITSAPSGILNSTTARIEFQTATTRAPATFECKLDSASYQACTSPWDLTGLAEGSHNVSVRAVDKSAKANVDPTPATATWTTDTTLPDTFIDSGPSDPVASTSASITFSSNRSGATFECRLDDAPFAVCTSPQIYSGLIEGTHTAYVRATVSGLTDPTPARTTWTVDTVAPQTSLDTKPSGSVASTATIIAFSSPDPTATYSCKIDTGDFTACTSPKSYTGLAQGSHTIEVRAQDAAGNRDPTPATATWLVDTIAPDTVIDSAQTGTTSRTTATVTFHSPDPTAGFRCRLDSGSYYACASPTTVTGLVEGEHMFVVQAGDAAGNRDPIPSAVRWTVDATPPDTMIDAAPSGLIPPGDATVAFHASEAGATLRCSINGSAPTPCVSPLLLAGMGVGSYVLTVQAVDAVGNPDPTPAQAIWSVVAPAVAQPAPAPAPPPANPPSAAPASAPAQVAALSVAFPKKRAAAVSWSPPAGATGYQVRISKKNSTKKFGRWRNVASPTAVFTGLKKKGKYIVVVIATNNVGQSPAAQLRFKQAR